MSGAFTAQRLENDFLLVLPLLVFPEGVLNGMRAYCCSDLSPALGLVV